MTILLPNKQENDKNAGANAELFQSPSELFSKALVSSS